LSLIQYQYTHGLTESGGAIKPSTSISAVTGSLVSVSLRLQLAIIKMTADKKVMIRIVLN